ncbi:Hypothetical_protein [Hexamita inflata]|uniref:Hypothetical_protein n=1 Tax=Hexamita inflata TaxID=28002 RepID=A0AA86P6L3_9EUKA|nr:Hypothetical protein HINF_LOCUS19463 [Hexamita inflata]
MCKQINYEINISDFKCSQELFTQQFDINSITHQITSSNNLSAGYVFSTDTTIQNAFIDISDNVYSTVYPLFQSQNTFTNLKIQFGTQSMNNGSLLLSSSSVSINQMNIISRPDGQLTVNSAQQLNILTQSSSSANITNLLINLSFAPSSGNITFISNINNILNIIGYQVLGFFVSTGTVAMIGLNINSATVSVNQVSFKPIAFNVGTGSSYLFGNAITMNTIQINNFAVILGNSSIFLTFGSISTTNSYNNYYKFGGLIAYINGNSVFGVNNVILDSYQKLSTSYVTNSGILVGQVQSTTNSITIQNICLQQNITSLTLEFTYFGLIGQSNGNTSIQNVSVSFSVQGAYFERFGIVGNQNGGQSAMVVNSRASISINSGTGAHFGSIFGFEYASSCSVQNTNVIGGNISTGSTNYVGGFIGYQYNNVAIAIINSSINQTNISGQTYIGGFIGYCTNQFTSSSSSQIYVNGVLRGDCAALSNWNGC